jgi:hypothetical protein
MESSPHPFAMAWTTGRIGDLEDGGQFYLASHAVRVQSAANTFVLWRPTLCHGTSLQRFHPQEENPTFSQTGLAIVTPPKIEKLWADYVEGKRKSGQTVWDTEEEGSSSEDGMAE